MDRCRRFPKPRRGATTGGLEGVCSVPGQQRSASTRRLDRGRSTTSSSTIPPGGSCWSSRRRTGAGECMGVIGNMVVLQAGASHPGRLIVHFFTTDVINTTATTAATTTTLPATPSPDTASGATDDSGGSYDHASYLRVAVLPAQCLAATAMNKAVAWGAAARVRRPGSRFQFPPPRLQRSGLRLLHPFSHRLRRPVPRLSVPCSLSFGPGFLLSVSSSHPFDADPIPDSSADAAAAAASTPAPTTAWTPAPAPAPPRSLRQHRCHQRRRQQLWRLQRHPRQQRRRRQRQRQRQHLRFHQH